MACVTCILGAAALLLAAAYWYLRRTFDYWARQNVPCMPDPVPGFGHMLPVITLKESLVSFAERLYKQTDASVMGFYFLRRPGIVLRDPELVKSVLQTNFSSFRLNMIVLDDDNDPILSKNPFFSVNPHTWKMLRARTVNHLSGRKLKVMHSFVVKVSSKMNEFVERKITEKHGVYECQLKDFFERYTGEFVANAAFGVEGESFEDNPSPKAFTRVAKVIMEPTFLNGLKQALLFYLPSVGKFFKVSFLQKSTDDYFRKTLRYIIKERRDKGVVVEDYLQFCLEDTTDEEFENVVADVILFYVDSYETTSLTLSLLFYQLSKNPEVQEKLRRHVMSVLESHGGEISYEALKDMTYMDQVIQESMRLMPALSIMQKMCTEEITLTGSDGLSCHFKPGQPVLIPTGALQRDDRFWSEPEVFNPDRFNPDNQADHHRFAYMPFGEGPRMCVGMRLGQMLVKLATASLILKFNVEKSSVTKEPLERDCNTILTYHKGGLWAKFKRI